MNKKSLFKLAAVLLFAVLAAVIPQYAQAAAVGTNAGDTITNTATVNFTVLGVAQTAAVGSTSFVVDRKIDLVVTMKGNVITGPSATTPALVYLVTNNSNTAISIGLSTQLSTTVNSYTPTNYKIWKDNGSGTYDGSNAPVSNEGSFGQLASGASVTVLVTATTPSTAVDGNAAGVNLIAQAYEPVSSGTSSVIGATGGVNNLMTVETVFADAAGSVDGQYDGKYSAMATFTVQASTISVTKSSIVYNDGLGDTSANAKAIPGATIEYTVIVTNSAGAATAQSVSLSDTLPGTLTSVNGSWSSTNATGGAASCNNQAYIKVGAGAWGCAGGWGGTGNLTLTVPITDLAPGATVTIKYQATIN